MVILAYYDSSYKKKKKRGGGGVGWGSLTVFSKQDPAV